MSGSGDTLRGCPRDGDATTPPAETIVQRLIGTTHLSFLSFEYQLRNGGLTWMRDTWCRCGLNDELVIVNFEVPPLFGTVPGFIPRHVDREHKTAPLDAVLAANRNHRLVQVDPFCIAHPAFSLLRGEQRHYASLAGHDQVALGVFSKGVLWRLTLDNRLLSEEFPCADEWVRILSKGRTADREKKQRSR